MHCDLGWRQREDQPPVTGVDRLVLQHVAEKRSVSLGVLAVDDDVSAVNHAPSVPAHETLPNTPLQRPNGSVARLPLPFAAERLHRWTAYGNGCGSADCNAHEREVDPRWAGDPSPASPSILAALLHGCCRENGEDRTREHHQCRGRTDGDSATPLSSRRAAQEWAGLSTERATLL